MPLRPITIRFTPAVRDMIIRAAAREGVSVAQYVREAVLTRAVLEAATAQREWTELWLANARELRKAMDELRRESRR